MLKKLFLVFTFFVLVHKTHAQLYPFTVFNTSNGLINNRCGTIAQDSAGYIWIGTDNGICNYDGRKFNFFPGHFSMYYFAHSQPSMYKGQCLLGASNGGLAKCAGNKLEFILPSKANNGHIISGIALNDSTYLLARYGGTKKLLLIEGKQEKEIAIPHSISEKMVGFHLLLQDAEKNIWVATNTGVFVFVKGNFEKPYVVPAFLNKYVNSIEEDFDNNVFVSCAGGVYKIEIAKLKNIEQVKPFAFFQSTEEIPALGFLKNGDILLGQITLGVKYFTKSLQWIKDITGENGLNNTVWDIFTDREGNTWFATENGLLRIRNFDFIFFPSPPSMSTSIINGAFYNNSFVFSNGKSLVAIQNEKLYKTPDAYNSKAFLINQILVTPDNELWANCFVEIANNNRDYNSFQYSFENGKAVKGKNIQDIYHLPGPVNMKQAITIAPGKMFFLTDDGQLHLYSHKKMLQLTIDSANMPAAFSLLANGIHENDLWLVNNKTGLYHCNIILLNNGARLELQQSIPFEKNSHTAYTKIFCDRSGNVWLSSYTDGIFVYKSKAGKYIFKEQIKPPINSSVMVTDMLQDSMGNVWAATNNGIDKITFSGSGHYSIAKAVYDNKLTGRQIFYLKEKNNHLYIGTTGSLAIANLATIETEVAPLIHINHITVNNKNADSLLTNTKSNFEPDENNISFEFVALSFINEKQTVYQYKLDGADTAWSSPSPNYTVAYARLKPGHYSFKVRAQNANGNWSSKDAIFTFTIAKPFYQHWAFFLLCAGIITGIVYWLYRQKIAGMIAVEKTRHHISKDLHDDIGTTLSSITLMNAVLKNKIQKNPDEAALLADKIEGTSRQMIQNMSDIVWSIHPGNDTFDKLQNRLQQFCADVFDDTDTRHKLTVSDTLVKKHLPMQLRRDVFLICKEVTNNAAKYSHAKIYMLTLSLDNKNIFIEAVDDGIGFDTASVKGGNGLNNIKQRVAANNGEVNLDTTNGTRWHIKIPVA